MARWIKTSLVILLVGLALDGASIPLLYAQQGANKPTILQKGDIADIPGREVVTATLELPPNGTAARHTHPDAAVGLMPGRGGVADGAVVVVKAALDRRCRHPAQGRAGPAGVEVRHIVVEKASRWRPGTRSGDEVKRR